MERGLYAAATGMLAQQSLQDVLAQNIANANTIGYKQDAVSFRSVQGMALQRLSDGKGRGPGIGELGIGVKTDKVTVDWNSGPLMHTGNPLDASLADGQFFAVQTPGGERYTRAGDLQLNATGRLVTSRGQIVLDTNNRPIQVPTNGTPGLDSVGNLTLNGSQIAKLKVVTIAPAQIEKEGDTLFRATTANAVRLAAAPLVRSGTLEQSNMDTVQGLVKMITVSRGFDMAQKAIQTQDELLQKASSEIGKL